MAKRRLAPEPASSALKDTNIEPPVGLCENHATMRLVALVVVVALALAVWLLRERSLPAAAEASATLTYVATAHQLGVVGYRDPAGALSPDGMIPEKGSDTAFRALASIDAEIAAAKLDLAAVYTNEFAKKANAKYPKG